MAEKLSTTDVDLIELNISCPNVKQGGVQFGTSCAGVENITAAVRAHCKKPLMVKLSPNVSDIGEIAAAAESGGADAISMLHFSGHLAALEASNDGIKHFIISRI